MPWNLGQRRASERIQFSAICAEVLARGLPQNGKKIRNQIYG
jgi:hypothetical protein